MTPLDDLAPEQRAVLELVLKRGRSYGEIAQLLSIDRARVRQRALAGFDALGPDTDVPAERRALITDYVLGQLPPAVTDQVRERLAQNAGDRAWARVISAELRPVAASPLPELPAAADADGLAAEEPDFDPGVDPVSGAAGARAHPQPGLAADAGPVGRGAGPADGQPEGAAARSSRLGGAIVLGIGALVVVLVVVVVLILTSSSSHHRTSSVASTPSATGSTVTGTGSTGTNPQPLATVRLSPPSSSSKAQGVAEAFPQSGKVFLALVAINLAPNSHNYYAVWLTNGPSDSRLIGFSQPVTSTGHLAAAQQISPSDSRYKTLVLTLETTIHPKAPGTTILSGAFHLASP